MRFKWLKRLWAAVRRYPAPQAASRKPQRRG
jgi:hypothetical protein